MDWVASHCIASRLGKNREYSHRLFICIDSELRPTAAPRMVVGPRP